VTSVQEETITHLKIKKTHTAKFTAKKYCKWCKQHTTHKEAKL
jgi:large subunit ribosomal protein L33